MTHLVPAGCEGPVGTPPFVMVSPVRIAVGTDERAPMLDALRDHLTGSGHEVVIVADGVDWPAAGAAVGRAVVDGTAEMGVVCCTTGTGVAIAANKVRGVRAALCTDAETARGARRWNDANVLAFGLRLTSESVAKEMVEAFLETPFDRAEAELVASVEDPELLGQGHR
jgi:ribose 5-phosphate isomerase B